MSSAVESFVCLAALVCLVMPLSACTHMLTDRDWNPYVRTSECEVREVSRDRREILSEKIQFYDAHGRHVSGTMWAPDGLRTWDNLQYDARGRLIATTLHVQAPGNHAPCLAEGVGQGGCWEPAIRIIERVDLEWDSGGRLHRKRDKRDEYHARDRREEEYIRQSNTDEVVEYGYDDAGRLLTVSSGGSRDTFEYDAHGRPVCVISEPPNPPRRAITYDADGRIASSELRLGYTNLFRYDDQGRVSRREFVQNSKIVRYDTWEYGAHGFVTRSVVAIVEPASKVRPVVAKEDEYLYFYDETGRLRETRDGSQLVTYEYFGKCDEVRLGPKSPSPMEEGDCTFTPNGVRETCQ